MEPVLRNVPKTNLGGIVSFKHPESKKIFDSLHKNDIICAVREGMVRLSPHFYNINDESDKVIEVLSSM